jgi:hypothetical protein
LIKLLGRLKKENQKFGELLRLKFAGTVDYVIAEMIIENGLEENYLPLGNIPRPDAIDLTLKAQMLLLPLNIADNAKGRIPGKLFENMRAQKPILVLGPTDSDVSGIVEKANAGITCEYNDEKAIEKFIMQRFNLFLENENTIQLGNIEEYSVKNQVKHVAEYLNEMQVG